MNLFTFKHGSTDLFSNTSKENSPPNKVQLQVTHVYFVVPHKANAALKVNPPPPGGVIFRIFKSVKPLMCRKPN